MRSLYEELDDKLKREPGVTKRNGPKQDIGLLLFSFREAIQRLWLAADAVAVAKAGGDKPAEGEELDAQRRLGEALEELRPLFGQRPGV